MRLTRSSATLILGGALALLASPAAAQTVSCGDLLTPARAPAVADPMPLSLEVGGVVYRRAGAALPLDPRRRVKVGQRETQAIYADTTVEPWSQLLLPTGAGWLQPYERMRDGALAGTSGSRAPSFPVAIDTERDTSAVVGMGAAPPTRPDGDAAGARRCAPTRAAVPGTDAPPVALAAPASTGLVTLPLAGPDGNRGIWVRVKGEIWTASGPARRRADSSLTPAGNIEGRELFRRTDEPEALYVPLRDGWVTRFTRER